MNIFHKIRERLLPKAEPTLKPGSSRAERGAFGEDLAARHCRQVLGYRIIVRNWRYKRDEVDLICLDGGVMVFIEVRARDENALVSGYYSVDKKKKSTLLRAYKNYLRQLADPPKHFRFDIIGVDITKEGSGEIFHYKNVPLFHKHFSARNYSS